MQFKRAITKKELHDVFELRYKVYCLERGYEQPDDHPHGIEVDEYDPYSIHFIAYIKGNAVGTTRLILPNPLGFPVERYCKVEIKDLCPDMSRVAEISRLAVSSEATKRNMICKRLITLGLIREMYRTINQFNIRYLVSAMGKGLERMLTRSGLQFLKAGEPVEYHGTRTPYFAAVDDMKERLIKSRKDIFDLLNISDTRKIQLESLYNPVHG